MGTKRSWPRVLAILAVITLVVAACGGDDDAGDGETFRIAIVAPSASNDLAFTQSIVDAVTIIQEDMGEDAIEFAVTDGTFVVEDAATAIRGYADDGYDLVIGHGSQYGASIEEIAADFPDTSFAWGTAADTFGLDNVFAYEAASDEGGYVMGVMAAMLTETDTIGVVGPIEVGDAALYVDGFAAGVTATDPAVTVNINYIGSFSDVALASEAAESHVASNADVMTGTAQMVVGAISVAQTNGVAWFGTQANQTSLADDIVVANQVYKWEVVLDQIIEQVQDGTLGGEVFEINLENGGLVIEYNDAYDLPDDVRSAGDEAAAGIADGSMSTGM
jgi:basic membrane lipoprotein Med (substrate-binding protein (PBP1-ABC) superfamily)